MPVLSSALLALMLPKALEPRDFWFVFLDRTHADVKLSNDQNDADMKIHLGNFSRLYDLGKLAMAGPIDDPKKDRAGTVILTVRNRKEVVQSFSPDQFVKLGIFKVDATKMRTDFGRLGRLTAEDRNKIEEARLVIWEGSTKAAASKEWLKVGRSTGLGFHAIAGSSGTIKAMAFFQGKDDVAIKNWIAMDPLVISGKLTATIYPQWLSHGIIQTK